MNGNIEAKEEENENGDDVDPSVSDESVLRLDLNIATEDELNKIVDAIHDKADSETVYDIVFRESVTLSETCSKQMLSDSQIMQIIKNPVVPCHPSHHF